jgi:1-deoxy-D-xylulose-5-phosphate synthase
VGIAEGHAVCFAAGLANQGLKPVVAIYSTFLQRSYDQIIEEAALQNLNIIFAIDRAGIVGGDGATHQGIFEIVFLRPIPNLVLMAPKDGNELKDMLEFAIGLKCAATLRYPKDNVPPGTLAGSPIELGKAELLKEGKDAFIIALGTMVIPSLLAAEILAREGLEVGVVNARFIKPLDITLFKKISSAVKFIFTVEEGVLEGGFGSAVSEVIDKPVIRIGLASDFIPCGKRDILLGHYGLNSQGIVERIKPIIK